MSFIMKNSINDILRADWDPIGVKDVKNLHDEYVSYVPMIEMLLKNRGDQKKVANYLLSIEKDEMGLAGDAARALRVAEKLCALAAGQR